MRVEKFLNWVRNYVWIHQPTVVVIIILSCFVISICTVKPLASLHLDRQIELFFGITIALFSVVEASSTHRQAKQFDKRNKIEDAWKTLERVYGPLYSLVNGSKYQQTGKEILNSLEIDQKDKDTIDHIMSTYPFCFPDEINEYWRKNIQHTKMRHTKDITNQPVFYIDVMYRDMINKEYERIVKQYKKLPKKM